MHKRMLGRTGLVVTTLGYGAMEVRGSRGPLSLDVYAEAKRRLDAVGENPAS